LGAYLLQLGRSVYFFPEAMADQPVNRWVRSSNNLVPGTEQPRT